MNNAGTSWGAALESYPVSGWEKVMQLNVTSVFSCIQQLLPLLRRSASAENPARVINIGSVAGISAMGEQAYAYGPSKAALHQLSRMLAKELVGEHINVNVIAPGRFPSRMTRHIANDPQALEADSASIPHGPLGSPGGDGGAGDQPGRHRRRLHDRQRDPHRRRFSSLSAANPGNMTPPTARLVPP